MGYCQLSFSEPVTAGSPASVKLSWEINKGWSGTLTYARRPPLGLSDTATVTITLHDGVNSITSPPLFVRGRSETEGTNGDSGTYNLIDTTSVILADGTQSFDTFLNTTSVDLVAALATRFSVSISGVNSFPIWKEDVKQSDGWTPLRRVAVVGGQQLLVNTSGGLQFVNNSWNTGTTAFVPKTTTRNYNPQDRFGALYVEKNLGVGTALGDQYYDFTNPGFMPSQALTTPLTVSQVDDSSSNGAARWVSFFNAADELCGQWRLGGAGTSDPIVGDWPAVRFSVVVESNPNNGQTNVRVRVVGTPPNPPPAGIDTAIAWNYGTGRGYPQPFSESLLPSKAWADANWAEWLKEINRGTHQLVGSAEHLDCSVRIGQTFTRLGQTGRIEKIDWDFSSASRSTVVTAEVLS